ncbi:hypothetical protein ALC60_07408 [Trachymyrmex zeteki]|uniref:Myb/SANT-like DNA-binding domain-containing protein n=1 Tax=Mycetomoellerius zeteki TaxID=64791 RepID=A0A151WZZ5_9HYME|nr:hypothetical protein ALC60_07408 [Trachymyrmex zeteki]
MEKVSLYDPERDIVVDVTLSPEDILRAQNDLTFATSLLNAAVKDKNITKNTESISIDGHSGSVPTQQITPIVQKPTHETNAEIDISNDDTVDNSMYRWSTAAVLLLLDTYKIFQDKFSSGKYSHKKIWDEISAILVEKGRTTTGLQCAAKLRSLKKSYKSMKDHNNVSGNDRRTWQFYEVQEKLKM